MDALRIKGKFSDVMEQETQKGILKFILVIKNAEDITWLAGPLAELKARLLQMRKIWGIELAVLNAALAGAYGLTC